jgi:release factor glutamine methyltransferase
MLLAESIPDLAGLTVVDIGTGSGFLAIVACFRGAARVYVLDTNEAAIATAMENAERNGVRDRFVHLPIGDTIIPLPPGEKVDVVISNPAQVPLPRPENANSAYYAGQDGRAMIEDVIRQTPSRLSPSGRLLMVHNSVTDFPKSMTLFKSVGLMPRVLAERSLELRSLFDRDWLDQIGGPARGLYTVRDGRAYETIYVVEASTQMQRPH